MTETKKEKFVRLAEKRTNDALKKIQLISNLANKNNYEYDVEQVNEIVSALEGSIKNLKQTYKKETDKQSKTFKFRN